MGGSNMNEYVLITDTKSINVSVFRIGWRKAEDVHVFGAWLYKVYDSQETALDSTFIEDVQPKVWEQVEEGSIDGTVFFKETRVEWVLQLWVTRSGQNEVSIESMNKSDRLCGFI